MFVTKLAQGGPAERGGLHPGDVFLTVGGEPTKTLDELARAFEKGSPGMDLPVVVERKGRNVQVSLVPEARP